MTRKELGIGLGLIGTGITLISLSKLMKIFRKNDLELTKVKCIETIENVVKTNDISKKIEVIKDSEKYSYVGQNSFDNQICLIMININNSKSMTDIKKNMELFINIIDLINTMYENA